MIYIFHLAQRNVQIVDSSEPGGVECVLVDSEGGSHILVSVFTVEDLNENSESRKTGGSCEMLEEFHDKRGNDVARILLGRPWGVERVDGLNEFVVSVGNLSD